MSTIGTGNLGSLSIVSSIAGAQRRDGDSNETKAHAAAQKFAVDQKSAAAASLDVGQAGQSSSDRDADGRQAYHLPEQRRHIEAEQGGEEAAHHPAPDADGICGRTLDLTA